MSQYFAGIGSRQTRFSVMNSMSKISKSFTSLGIILRTGHAKGADNAFQRSVPDQLKEIYTDDDATNEAIEFTKYFHPAWHKCPMYARYLHARNAMIILGKNLDSPVEFVVCWTKDGKDSGGTGQGIRIAKFHEIPVYNLFYKNHLEELRELYFKMKNKI